MNAVIAVDKWEYIYRDNIDCSLSTILTDSFDSIPKWSKQMLKEQQYIVNRITVASIKK
jgi:hypothetical protein